jgi:hypothetical protein
LHLPLQQQPQLKKLQRPQLPNQPQKLKKLRKPVLKKLTKKILLNEDLRVDAGASIQALYDIVSSIRVTNKRDTGRVHLAKEHIRAIKREMRSLNERVNVLEEEIKVLTEDK